jgi:hypothetical protein
MWRTLLPPTLFSNHRSFNLSNVPDTVVVR